MRKEYKYSNLNKETNTSGKVTLELMKQRKIKTKPRGSKQPAWAVAMEQRINKRLDNVENRLDQNDKHWQHQEEFNQMVIDQFKKHKWIK